MGDMADHFGADGDCGPECPICGGPGVELGQLGATHHFRCRNCGMQFSHTAEEVPWSAGHSKRKKRAAKPKNARKTSAAGP